MRVLVQRSLESSVSVDYKVVGKISKGLVLLVGFHKDDTVQDIDYMIQKVLHLRIFNDEQGMMNRSILESNGEILSISQFTLYADTKKGNRPSYIEAMKSDQAKILYNLWNQKLRELIPVETGVFGADMKVSITNDGPITIMLESRSSYDKK
jgi:D-tyrosyl-tRNA(Tyr) deacylase